MDGKPAIWTVPRDELRSDRLVIDPNEDVEVVSLADFTSLEESYSRMKVARSDALQRLSATQTAYEAQTQNYIQENNRRAEAETRVRELEAQIAAL